MIRPISAPIPGLNNATFPVPVAAVVGGGTVVNGMGYSRGSDADYDDWGALSNPGWDYAGLAPYFPKHSTFDAVSPATVEEFGVTWDATDYGNGPLHVTIPDFEYPDVKPFQEAWVNDGTVPVPPTGDYGVGPGFFWLPSSIDKRDGTRSTSRKAYYDPVYQQRPNLHILTNTTVTEIIIDNLHARGVKIRGNRKVYARKEVILAAGSIQTPQLLQRSGIGPKAVLEKAGVKVKKDHPAVGANLQDHPVAFMIFNITRPSFPNL